MSRLMSVAFTEPAVLARIKTVTRRAGWWEDKNGRRIVHPGDTLTLCRKVMGRKKGEPLVRLTEVEIVNVRREGLYELIRSGDYGRQEMILEGFRGMDPADFIRKYFTEAQKIHIMDDVTRIEWRYVETQSADRV